MIYGLSPLDRLLNCIKLVEINWHQSSILVNYLDLYGIALGANALRLITLRMNT